MPRHIPRNISLPPDLDALRALHAARLPTLSQLAEDALRQALAALDVPLPSHPLPTRTSAATAARSRKRSAEKIGP